MQKMQKITTGGRRTMKLNDLVKLIVDNPVKKLVTDRELEQTVMFCCESIWGREPIFRLGKFIQELCENERMRIDRKSGNGFKIWKAEDIRPGRRYTKKGTEEVWTIGYRADAVANYKTRYVSVSENDGMVTHPYTKEDLAGILNENGYVPVDIL
jgi:hypothetical protein